MIEVGTRIRELRLNRHMGQAELGALADVNPVTLSEIERGGNTTLETLKKLAAGLGVPISAFFLDPIHNTDDIEALVDRCLLELNPRIRMVLLNALTEMFRTVQYNERG